VSKALLLSCAFFLLGCPSPRVLPLGKRIPARVLYQQRADIGAVVEKALAKKDTARAFYALELLKTRPYAAQVLSSRATVAPPALRDLRGLFAKLYIGGNGTNRGTRGLTRVRVAPVLRAHMAVQDEQFWRWLRLFELRTNPLNATTRGLPYDYAARYSYGVSSAAAARLLFSKGEAFVSYYVGRTHTWAFVLKDARLRVRKLPTGNSAMRAQVERFLKALRTPPATAGAARAWVVHAKRVYDMVWKPLERDLAGNVAAVFVSTHGFLSNLPFSALVDRPGAVLLDRLRIAYVPSVSVYRQTLARPLLNKPPRVLSIGNAMFPGPLKPLRFADSEAVTVSEVFDGSRLLRRKQATETRVRRLIPGYNVLHFATHGVLFGDFAPGASSLMLTADAAHDGFLSATEVAAMDLSHVYVAVLSACETSVNDPSSNLGSLTGAFLSAGVPSVVGSLWMIHDAATTVMMIDFYSQVLEVGAGEALRRAQLRLRRSKRFAHPYFWAPIVLFGWAK